MLTLHCGDPVRVTSGEASTGPCMPKHCDCTHVEPGDRKSGTYAHTSCSQACRTWEGRLTSPPRAEHNASTSSMKMVDGAWCRAISNSVRISFSESPRHLEMTNEADML